ncbi:MAG: VCBS repeat-containing protein, partial [Deltaproteobacteria bacterium]|nr:VCBS repeat-containing protein [Deltaproteobacteria bacterium]
MKSKIHFIHIDLIIFLTLLMTIGLQNTYAQTEPVRIAITPFTLNAPDEMSYLQSGVQDMLESRLSQDEDVIVISDDETARAIEGIPEPIDENKAREVGRRLNARYVLIGSLTVFGSSASLDARLVDVSGEKATLAFFEQSDTIDDLVPKINAIAADINLKIGGAAVVAAAPKPAAGGNDVQAHPEKLETGELAAEAGDSGLTASAAGGILSEDFWKSRTYKFNIHGLALGDVDGDGKIETVIITNNTLAVYRYENNQFFKTQEIEESSSEHFVGVDVADINGNGYAEIFVPGLTPKRTGVASSIYEYSGGPLQRVLKKSRWL